MKRTLAIILLTILTFGMGLAKAPKKNNEKEVKTKTMTIYAYGLSTCFNDSAAYITDIIEIKGANYLPKTKFLEGRHDYSMQLKEYFTKKDMPNQVCTFFFTEKREKTKKEYDKLCKRLKEKDGYNLNYLTTDEFTFRHIDFTAE